MQPIPCTEWRSLFKLDVNRLRFLEPNFTSKIIYFLVEAFHAAKAESYYAFGCRFTIEIYGKHRDRIYFTKKLLALNSSHEGSSHRIVEYDVVSMFRETRYRYAVRTISTD